MVLIIVMNKKTAKQKLIEIKSQNINFKKSITDIMQF